VGKALAEIVGEANVLVVPTDVSKLEEVVRLRDKVYEDWGEVSSIICSTHKTLLHLDAHWHRRLPSKFNTRMGDVTHVPHMIQLAFTPTRCPLLLVFPFAFIGRQHASCAKDYNRTCNAYIPS